MDERASLTNSTAAEEMNLGNLKDLLVPLIEKVAQLRESVDTKYSKLESAISMQKKEV